MISAKSSAPAVNRLTVATGDPNDPNAPHAAGVYLYEEANGQKKMTKLMGESFISSGHGSQGELRPRRPFCFFGMS
jgi:hypothetical protein